MLGLVPDDVRKRKFCDQVTFAMPSHSSRHPWMTCFIEFFSVIAEESPDIVVEEEEVVATKQVHAAGCP